MTNYEAFVGKVLDNRYRILEIAGIGGMSSVLKAQDLRMNRIVAIKILNDEYNGNEAAEAQFIDESKAVAMLSAKNIVNVYDVAIYDDIKYIVMEFIDGITLREYLDNKNVIGWKEACIYTLQVLRALEHAHSKGIIHRDIKPQNVILMKNGDIKVMDFGIAKLPNSISEQASEKAVGTVYYISPEQACGKPTDSASDIYSVGIMLYEAVTGTLPFLGETPLEIATKQVNEEPVHPRDIVLDIPVGVSQIILKALEKDPADRFHTAHSMAKALEWVLRNPEAIFAMESVSAEENMMGVGNVVAIDMIDTSEIEPFNEDDISSSLGIKKPIPQPVDKVKKKKKKKDEPKEPKKKKKVSRSMFPIISGVSLAFLLVAVILLVTIAANALSSWLNPEEKEESEFPNIVSMTYSDALKDDLRNGKYGAKIVIDEVVYDSRDDVENNVILSTDPVAGHLSRPGDDGKLHFTRVTVNRSEKVILPDLTGYAKTHAQTVLSNLSLKAEFVEKSDTSNPYYNENQVIETSPEAGAEIKVGDTVTVYILKRAESTVTGKMPNVIGMTAEAAKRYAETNALYKVTFVEQESDTDNGKVIAQSINEGVVSPVGTEVILTVSVPFSGALMPYLIGSTASDARAELAAVAPDMAIKLNLICYTADESLRSQVDSITGPADLAAYIVALEMLGCRRSYQEDENATIIFQEFPANFDIPTGVREIDVIVITYNTDPSNDTSDDVSDDTHDPSNDESGDISGGNVSDTPSEIPDESSAESAEVTN